MLLKTSALTGLTFTALLLLSSGAQADDPPLRVGRVSYLEGSVSFHAADEDNWSYATLNYPVVSGNAFWTEPDGRTEVQIGAVEVRMDHSTELEVTQLDENNTRLEVPQGIVNIHFSTPPLNGTVEVMTPEGPVTLNHPGTYHIDAGQPGPNGPSTQVTITPLEGELDVQGPNQTFQVMDGEMAVLNGNPAAFSVQEGNPTPFDDWALARERREEAHATAQFVSPHVTGYEDLDAYGRWAPDPTYGQVWYPATVQADWAPYRYGHWAYVAPWGWTWVDSAPWGFAPFHYGRWAQVDNRWGWIPGDRVERPVYAPALVAFVGGAGWSVSLSLGGSAPAIGWVPLGPREVFHPYYPVSVNYARNVNVAYVDRREINNITVNNIHNVTVNNYVNQRAATVVPTNAFTQGQPVHKAFVPVSHDQLMHAPLAQQMTHLAPERENRALAPSVQDRAPEPEIRHPGESQPEHMSVTAPAVQQPHAPEAPHSPEPPRIVHVEGPQHVNATAPSGTQNVRPAQPHVQPQERVHAGYAPGPQIHPASPQERQKSFETGHPPGQPNIVVPHGAMQHPQQQTHITPTPKGWQRTPQPHEQPRPPQAHEAPHPEGQEHHENQPH